jgi:uncharacterized protein
MRAVATCLLLLSLAACANAGIEKRFLYHPRPYSAAALEQVPGNIVQVRYTTPASGSQVAWYVPPVNEPGAAPRRLWLLFGGNGSLALDWLHLARGETPDPDAGFLLVDYPGYGLCEGAPSEKEIARNCDAAVEALATLLGVTRKELEADVGVMGHSLGSAVAIQYAAAHPVRRIVLIAPFTSIGDMARRTAGFVGRALVSNGFDSTARIPRIVAQDPPPRILIVHGKRDRTIPVGMGRALAALGGEHAEFVEFPGANHTSILYEARDRILEFMSPPPHPAR